MVETGQEQTGMSPREIDTMRSVEDVLWWYRALRGHVLASLRAADPAFNLLDAGCGSGGMLARIREQFPQATLAGLDFSARALELTEQRKINARLVQGRADQLPFCDGEFDVVLSLDVLVLHGVNEKEAVREMHRVLRKGGMLIVNVAAFDFLRGSHDVATNMARRYTRPRLARLLRDEGFTIESLSYWNMLLMPAVGLVRWASRRQTTQPDVRSDLAPMWAPLNLLLSSLAQTELVVSRNIPLPFGTSLFARARK